MFELDADETPRGSKLLPIILLVGWTILITAFRTLFGNYHLRQALPDIGYDEAIGWIIQYLGTSLLILYWCHLDAHERKFPLNLSWKAALIIGGPIALLSYFSQSRTPEAVSTSYAYALTFGVGLWLLSWLVTFSIYYTIFGSF